MPDRLELWQVFYLFCHCALPIPKNKYVVLVCLEPTLGFLINSRINKFIAERPKLLACEVPLTTHQHPFLSHDSFIDCREICPLPKEQLIQFVGNLSTQSVLNLTQAVSDCPVLAKRYKKLILQ
jgi:hypothetical protein